MKKIIIIVSLLLPTSHIMGQKEGDLTSDKDLTKIFNETEIQGLKTMIQFVDNMVLDRENTSDANEAYHLYFDEISRSKEYIVPFKENIKYEFLESLDSIQFASIWYFTYHIDMIRTGDTIYRNLENFKTLDIKPFSKYMDYLKVIGKDDPYFKNLQQEFEVAGNLMLDSSYWFPENHTKFDFNIPKYRLWAAIYLLRREETTEMKLQRYLKNK